MTTAKFFAYKGNLACSIDPNGKFINDPTAPGQLGSVVSTTEVGMTAEAKALIKGARREGGSFAALMLTKHEGTAVEAHGKSSIGILGGFKAHFGTDIEIGRDCDKSVLDDCQLIEMEVPEDYKQFIDSK